MNQKWEEFTGGVFPRSVLSTNRAEFGAQNETQDTKKPALKLLVKDDKKVPEDLQGHVFIIGPVGSVCKLAHPELKLGFTVHTTWLPKISKRTATYNIPVEDDYKDLVAKQPPEIQELFEKEIYPHFKRKPTG